MSSENLTVMFIGCSTKKSVLWLLRVPTRGMSNSNMESGISRPFAARKAIQLATGIPVFGSASTNENMSSTTQSGGRSPVILAKMSENSFEEMIPSLSLSNSCVRFIADIDELFNHVLKF